MRELVCLSGGIDSAVVLAASLANGNHCEVLLFDYGQPHSIELRYAIYLSNIYNVDYEIIDLPNLPKSDDVVFAGRNLLLVAHAVGVAAAKGFDSVALGCNQSDWERFPDCRPEFWSGIRTAAKAYKIIVSTPLLHMTKTEVVKLANKLNVPLQKTWSCYNPQYEEPCGECLACKTRKEAGA